MKKKIIGSFVIMLLLLTVCACGNQKEKNDVYSFQYENKNLILGDTFTTEKYGKEVDYVESPSCAFDGLDKIYRYEHYEVTTYPDQEQDRIYSIFFLDDEVETTEGLKIGDTKEKMLELYGKDFEQKDSLFIYQKEKTELHFLLQDDTIISIEYDYIVE